MSNLSKNTNHKPQIVEKTSVKLTKSQQQLERLTNRIESLKFDIAAESEKLSVLLDLYGREVKPQLSLVAQSRVKLAQALDRAVDRIGFAKRQQNAIAETIVGLLREAFEVVDPSDELIDLYDRWSKQTFREDADSSLQHAKQLFADMMWQRYGVEIDVEDIEDSTEGFEEFRERMRREQQQARAEFNGKYRQKSEREKKREEIEQEKENLKLKGIRSVYIGLVKVLHPDSETNDALKTQKEELMKQVTTAYEKNDLQTLLALEMEWIHNDVSNLAALTDEKVKLYLQVLREQVADLEAEKLSVTHSPQYQSVASYAAMPLSIAKGRILSDKRSLKGYSNGLLSVVTACRGAYAKHHILEFVDYYLERARNEQNRDDSWRSVEI